MVWRFFWFSCLVLIAFSANAEDFLLFDETPIVITPTRLKQSLHDVPASTTVIDKAAIKSINAKNLIDVLSLVPGFAIYFASGNQVEVAYHSGNNLPRRLQVLIDGVSVYQNLIARVDWEAIPVAIEDIERIEVIRSPNTVTYGANSFNAIFNIITTDADTDTQLTYRTVDGSQDWRNHYIRYNNRVGKTNFRFSVSDSEHNGHDHKRNEDPEDRDGLTSRFINVQTNTNVSEKTQLQVKLYHGNSDIQDANESAVLRETSFPDKTLSTNIANLLLSYDRSDQHNIRWQTYINEFEQTQAWGLCGERILFSVELSELLMINRDLAEDYFENASNYFPIITVGGLTTEETTAIEALNAWILSLDSNPFTAATLAFSEVCGNGNQNIHENSIRTELQNTYKFNDNWRLVSTVSLKQVEVESETYINGKKNNAVMSFSNNAEYKPSERYTFNIGGIWEKTDYIENEFSTRAAVNFHLNRSNTIRVIYSEAVRTPDIFEEDADWRYLFTDVTPSLDGETSAYLALQSMANSDLQSEKVAAKEISYFSSFRQGRLNLDLKIFQEDYTSLISETFTISDGFTEQTNNGEAFIEGTELELTGQLNKLFSLRFYYTEQDIDTNNQREEALVLDNSRLLALTYQPLSNWQFTLAHFEQKPLNYEATEKTELFSLYRFNYSPDTLLEAEMSIVMHQEDNSFRTVDLFIDDEQYFVGLTYKKLFN